jgi:hypothetical protein
VQAAIGQTGLQPTSCESNDPIQLSCIAIREERRAGKRGVRKFAQDTPDTSVDETWQKFSPTAILFSMKSTRQFADF